MPLHTHSHFTPIVASGKEYSITFLEKLFREKKTRKIVTTLPAHHLAQKRKILNLYFYAVIKAQVT